MGFGSTLDNRLADSIPHAGVREVLRGWSGEGSLYESLASVVSPDPLDWSPSDIRRRAHRVLLEIVEPMTADWPNTSAEWQDFLPSSSVGEQQISRVPAGAVNWRETRRAGQWPPHQYVLRTRQRVMDETAVGTLLWLSENLQDVVDDVQTLSPTAAATAQERLDTLATALSPWHETDPLLPDRVMLRSLKTSGHPWVSVGDVAELVVRSKLDPEFIAFEMIVPADDLGWRLFHLATYGMVIRALQQHRFVVTWRRPISGKRPGAQIEAIGPTGTRFDLWFEAAAARSFYGLPKSAFHDAVQHIVGAGGQIGVDIMLIDQGERALLIECKLSSDPSYVGRYGFHQAASYALDAMDGLASEVWSFVAGPSSIVPETSVAAGSRSRTGVVLGSTSPDRIADVVSGFLAGEPNDLL